MVRARSNAAPVAPANVDIDYILDERMREFGVEEKRMFTLTRLGKVYDRIVKCNQYYNGANGGKAVAPHNNLWQFLNLKLKETGGGIEAKSWIPGTIPIYGDKVFLFWVSIKGGRHSLSFISIK